MRSFRPLQIVAAVAASLVCASASAQFSNAYVFGDSLADAGQYGARFTTNPGLAFPMYLTQRYGITVTPSFAGGTDFAQGGARVNSPNLTISPPVPDFSVAQQVGLLLSKGSLDPNALYQIDGGANDILTLVSQLGAGQISQAQLQGGVVQAAIDLTTQVARLQAGGARYIVVYNLPDVGKTPYAAAIGAQADATVISALFNSTLNGGIGNAKLNVIQVNTFALLNEIVANPAAYGFTNISIPACTTASSLQCTPATLRDPSANLTFLFADPIHPTTGLALIAAQAAASMIEGPAKIGALAEAPLGVEEANFRTIDGRMISAFNTPRNGRKYEAWAAYDYSNADVSGQFLSGNSDQNTVAAGGDIKISDNLIAGIAFGYSENKGDFGGGTGDFKLKETSGTGYVGYGSGPWYVGGTFGVGDLDFDNVTRHIQLGAANRTETGRTNGWHIMASAHGGYWFQYNQLLHGPFVRFRYQDIRVHAYAEDGADSTALAYAQQSRKSLISTIGWQGSTQFGPVRPFARIAWEFEGRNDERFVTATPVALNGTYSIPTVKPDDNWVRYLLGVSTEFGRVTGYLTGEGTSSRNNGDGYAITLGIRVPI